MNYKDKVFEDEEISLDGNSFDQCVFKRCQLTYYGGDPPSIVNCTILPQTSFGFGGSASRTIEYLRVLSDSHPVSAGKFEELIRSIGIDYGSADETLFDESNAQTFDFLASHSQHAIGVAKIAAIFSSIEFMLCQVFSWMLQCYPMHAAAAYYQLTNNKARRDMIRGLIPYLHSDEERDAMLILIEKVQQAAKIRNIYSHALWQKKGDKLYITENLATNYPHGTKRPIPISLLLSEVDAVQKIAKEIGEIFEKMTAKRPLSLSPDSLKPSFATKFLRRPPNTSESDSSKPQSETETQEGA